jgi:pimeloyl-ACP methyl ester carboxylesterase
LVACLAQGITGMSVFHRKSSFYLAALMVAVLLLLLLSIGASYFYLTRALGEESKTLDEYKFISTSCWFDADWTASIRCGELHTPKTTGAFRLPVVILKDESAAHRHDPVVYLQGGPGAGARLHSAGVKEWLSWMRYAGLARDIILIDTRGTGRSTPALVCAEYNRINHKMLRENISLADELALSFSVTAECFAAAVARNTALDYRHFSTAHSARDVRALMQALGYEQWNILGVSYGTRLALEIASQETLYPQSSKLKSMVLDSVYPAGFGGVQTWPKVLDEAMQKFFSGCAVLPECINILEATDAPLSQLFLETLESLRESPMELVIRRWDGEAPVSLLLNDHRFLSAAFAATYSPRNWLKIAEAMKGVSSHRQELLKPLLEPFINQSMSDDFNSLTFGAVDCADNPVMSEQEYMAIVAQYPLLQDYTRDQWRYQLCHRLTAEQVLQRQAPSVPTLILAGELDPVTPVTWAQAVHAEWGASQLHISKHVAHAVLGSEACLLQALIHYYDDPDAAFAGCATELAP